MVFIKKEICIYYQIDEVINKLQPYNHVNVIVKVTRISEIIKIRNLEFIVTDGESLLVISQCSKLK